MERATVSQQAILRDKEDNSTVVASVLAVPICTPVAAAGAVAESMAGVVGNGVTGRAHTTGRSIHSGCNQSIQCK